RAMMARRTRRKSSSLLPLNMTPAITSIHPPAWWKGPLGPLTTGRDLGGVGLPGPVCRDHLGGRRQGVRAGVRPERRTFRGPDRRGGDRREVDHFWVVHPGVCRPGVCRPAVCRRAAGRLEDARLCRGLPRQDGASRLEADVPPLRGVAHAPARAAATRRLPARWRRIPGAKAREKSLRGVVLPEPILLAARP